MRHLELLEHIFPIAKNNPVIICCVFRKLPNNICTRLIGKINHDYDEIHTSIELKSMNEPNCRKLVKDILNSDNIPPKILQYIIKRADGVPLFVEEIVTSLLDMKILIPVENNNSYRVDEYKKNFQSSRISSRYNHGSN